MAYNIQENVNCGMESHPSLRPQELFSTDYWKSEISNNDNCHVVISHSQINFRIFLILLFSCKKKKAYNILCITVSNDYLRNYEILIDIQCRKDLVFFLQDREHREKGNSELTLWWDTNILHSSYLLFCVGYYLRLHFYLSVFTVGRIWLPGWNTDYWYFTMFTISHLSGFLIES